MSSIHPFEHHSIERNKQVCYFLILKLQGSLGALHAELN